MAAMIYEYLHTASFWIGVIATAIGIAIMAFGLLYPLFASISLQLFMLCRVHRQRKWAEFSWRALPTAFVYDYRKFLRNGPGTVIDRPDAVWHGIFKWSFRNPNDVAGPKHDNLKS